MSKEEQFEYESLHDNQTVGKYLKALIQGFEKGRISFVSEEGRIVLCPNNLLRLRIKAVKKDDTNRLSVRISWKDSQKEEPKESNISIG
jgi:amphi-Trp domain-containing protein